MKFIFITFFIFFIYVKAFSYSNEDILFYYNKFYKNIENTITDKNEKLSYLENFSKKLEKAKSNLKNEENIEIISEFINLNIENINSLKLEIENNNNSIIEAPSIPYYIIKLQKNWYKYIELDKNNEYYLDWIYRLTYDSFNKITPENHTELRTKNDKNWIIIRKNNEFLIVYDSKTERKIPYKELSSMFNNYIDNNFQFFVYSWAYYGQRYSRFTTLNDPNWIYLSQLDIRNIDFKKTLLVKNNNKYLIVNDYKTIKLVNEDIVKDIEDKKKFLSSILDDNRFYNNDDNEDILLDIKKTTLALIWDKSTNDEKIQEIYKYIVENMSYYSDFANGDKTHFSWLLTFKNKSGVCDWYTKLFYYMLSFAWIDDVEIKTGYAFDNIHFPTYWHAWVRIWENYYDPTFDNTLWFDEYYYYKLPKELMYYNRFDWKDIPPYIKNLSLEERKEFSNKKLSSLYKKYSNYNLLNKVRYNVSVKN